MFKNLQDMRMLQDMRTL